MAHKAATLCRAVGCIQLVLPVYNLFVMSDNNNLENVVANSKTKSTKYLLTINNPIEHGLDRDTIIRKCAELGPVYVAMSDEIGLNEKTPHTHVYIVFRNARSFNKIKACFEAAHIDRCFGSHDQNIDYVFKQGKWEQDAKGETNLRDTHYEAGTRPENNQGRRTDLAAVKEMIDDEKTVDEIIDAFPNLIFKYDQIGRLVEMKKDKKYKREFREVEVYYIWGPTKSGKTYYVFDHNDIEQVYRMEDGKNPFDNYNGEDVLFMDEYHSDLSIGMFLKLTDKYPVHLVRRYYNKVVRYHKVYVVSNVPIEAQYPEIASMDPNTYDAFLGRFKAFIHFESRTKRTVYNDYNDYRLDMGEPLEDYLKRKEAKKAEDESK